MKRNIKDISQSNNLSIDIDIEDLIDFDENDLPNDFDVNDIVIEKDELKLPTPNQSPSKPNITLSLNNNNKESIPLSLNKPQLKQYVVGERMLPTSKPNNTQKPIDKPFYLLSNKSVNNNNNNNSTNKVVGNGMFYKINNNTSNSTQTNVRNNQLALIPTDEDNNNNSNNNSPLTKTQHTNNLNIKPNKRIKATPLAESMRPSKLNEFVGHSKLLSEGSILSNLIKSGEFFSLILYGPPGCGKTSLSKLLLTSAKEKGYSVVEISAIGSNVKELRDIITIAKNDLNFGRKTIVFIDEIHRYSSSQQQELLGPVENGTITLIGSTTENPSFQIIHPMVSRCTVFHIEKLTIKDISTIIKNAIVKSSMEKDIIIEQDTIEKLAEIVDGDARKALNAIDLAIKSFNFHDNDGESMNNSLTITVPLLSSILQKTLPNDKHGDNHYTLISALHKSVRGSDPNATTYWITRMLRGGTDPLYIARRMIRMASEDIGLADPQALVIATSGYKSVKYVGMPECSVCLLQVATYLAMAPKSNSLENAWNNTTRYLEDNPTPSVPSHLINAPTKMMKDFGYGVGYQYNHDYEDPTKVTQIYLPESINNIEFFNYKLTIPSYNELKILKQQKPSSQPNNNNNNNNSSQNGNQNKLSQPSPTKSQNSQSSQQPISLKLSKPLLLYNNQNNK